MGEISRAVEAYAAGRMVLIIDDPERENEGDVAIAAQYATPEVIAFLALNARGLICMPMIGARLDELEIPLMTPCRNGGTAFTVSVDARCGTTTGISAADRARTVRTLLDPTTRPHDLSRPGHLFPLRYAEGGVLGRRGHTEASVDLCRLASLYPAAVICEVMNDDGTMARGRDLTAFALKHDIPMVSVAQIADYLLS